MPALLTNAIFDVISQLNAATSVAATWHLYMEAAKNVGLGHGIACFYPDTPKISDKIFGATLPEGWLNNYVVNDYQAVDPLISLTRKAIRPVAWSLHSFAPVLNNRQMAWRDDNNAAGMRSGITFPDRRDGHMKLISITGDPGNIDPKDQKCLYFAGLEALARMHELGLSEQEPIRHMLSARELECLRWVAAGKSDTDTGVILNISDKTVGAYIERAKQKLGVRTRAQAIVSAMRLGELF